MSEDVRGEEGSRSYGVPAHVRPPVGGGSGTSRETRSRSGDLLAAGAVGAAAGFALGLDLGANDATRETAGRVVHGVASVLAQMGMARGRG